MIVLLLRGSYALGRNTAQVESLSVAVTEVRNEVVGEVRAEISQVRAEIGQVRAEARRDNQQLRRTDNQQLRTELKQDNQQLRTELKQDVQQLRTEMVAGFQQLAEAIDAMRIEVQQNNQMLAALANHTHDTDGRTVFTVPATTVRQ